MPFVDTGTPRKPQISAAAAALMEVRDEATARATDNERLTMLLQEARSRIIGQLTPAQIENPSISDTKTAEGIIRPLVEQVLRRARENGEVVRTEPAALINEIMDRIFGYGVLTPYLDNDQVEEIICNGPQDIWIIHAQQGKVHTEAHFSDANELLNTVVRMARGRELSRSSPKIDARMRDGSRLHAVIEPLVVNVPIAVTIRRHRLVARTLADLERLGTITPEVREFLEMLVQGRVNLVIAGGTASGKTNFLNALANAAQETDRFVVVEDTPEIQIAKPDVVQLTTRDQAEAARSFSIADLVIEALRMRPDRIITGEARGPEVVDVLSAANTGHDGQMLTLHANSTRDVIQRFETMYLMRGIEVPITAIRRQIADAFQVVIFLKRVLIGNAPRRFVTEIAEISPSRHMEGDQVVVQNIFEDTGHGLHFTGYFPKHLAELLQERGVPLSLAHLRRSK